MSLAGNVALVTGGGRGIGRAVALALGRAGADVAVAARSPAQIDAVAAEIRQSGRRAVAIPCDVGERRDVERLVKTVETELGPPEILVNSAGVAASAKFVETDDDLWERHLRVNLTGTFYVCRAVVPGMIQRRGGRIINIASTSGKVPYLYVAAYCASKHGVVGLTRAMALELARYGITVNAICPGWVQTELTDQTVENIVARTGMAPEDAVKTLAQMSPQNRLIQPEEIATLALLLASRDAYGINGQAINLDGGGVMV
jgi:NAD(P)-dependent dehydrogenase (short-subunit alcohol dehydrogenase family)